MKRSIISLSSLLLLTVLIAASSSPVSAQVTWVTFAPLPEIREGAAGAVAGNQIFVANGFSFADTTDLRIWGPADAWAAGPADLAPASSEHYYGITAQRAGVDRVYVIGGRSMAFGSVLTNVREFTPGGGWLARASMPTGRAGAGVAVLGNLIHVVGGRTGTVPFSGVPLAVHEVYDPNTNLWAALAPLPVATSGLGLVELNGKLYAVGGWVVIPIIPFIAVTANTWIYDPVTNTWTPGVPMLVARAYLGVGKCGSFVYALGGNINTVPTPTSETNTNQRFDGVAWTSQAPMPTPRDELVVVTLNNVLHAIGGGIFGNSVAAHEGFTCAPPPQPVGGEILSINTLQVLAPWVAVIAVLGVVSVHTLVIRRRRRTLN